VVPSLGRARELFSRGGLKGKACFLWGVDWEKFWSLLLLYDLRVINNLLATLLDAPHFCFRDTFSLSLTNDVSFELSKRTLQL
jgi:hypothetical protein